MLLLQSRSDQDPGQFWVYQAAGAVGQRVGAVRKDFEPRRMATLDESRLYALPDLIGDPVADAAMLKANSPLAQAERIRTPLLRAYGQQDARLPITHG